jgi:hypothetical protein
VCGNELSGLNAAAGEQRLDAIDEAVVLPHFTEGDGLPMKGGVDVGCGNGYGTHGLHS